MLRLPDATVDIVADLDYAEGWVHFQFPDPAVEGIRVDLEGHWSRDMPIRSGSGKFDFVALRRDALRIRFEPSLAQKLELEEELEIGLSISETTFSELQSVIDWFNGLDEPNLT